MAPRLKPAGAGEEVSSRRRLLAFQTVGGLMSFSLS